MKSSEINDYILAALNDSVDNTLKFGEKSTSLNSIALAVYTIMTCWKNNGRVYSIGNGGSMTQAMHFAEELTGRYAKDRRGLAAIAICDPSHIACVANDYGFEHIFSRYIQANGSVGDVLLALSTSGNSQNIATAIAMAKSKSIITIGITGSLESFLGQNADVIIHTPAKNSARQQEIHLKVIHIMVDLLEQLIEE